MAIDEELNRHFRDAIEGLVGISEKNMMGGTCFLLNGNMLGGADITKTGERRYMFRVGKDNEPEALKRPGAEVMEMSNGRRMSGIIFVGAECIDKNALDDWIKLAISFVGNLPPK